MLKTDIHAGRRIVLAMDCWSKKGLSESFLAISASFFNPLSNTAQHSLLNVHKISHPHTGQMLGEKIEETLRQWKIDSSQILMAVTDNGSNMIKAINTLKFSRQVSVTVSGDDHSDDREQAEEGDDNEENEVLQIDDDDELEEEETTEDDLAWEEVPLHRLPCVAHTLQLVLKEIDNNAACCSLITKTRALVKSLRKSGVATGLLIEKCGKTVVVDCSTRWSSVYLMISRLLEIKPALLEVLDEMKLDGLLNSEWARLAELCKLLEPFKEQTDIMQTDTLSLSSIIPTLLELSLHLQEPCFTKTLSVPLLSALRRRFAIFLDPASANFDPIAAAATFLDPTVSSTTLQRDDMGHLLHAAKTYINKEASSRPMHC